MKSLNDVWTTDEIIKQAIKEKHGFESHPEDICYARHHMKAWIYVDLECLKKKFQGETITLTKLKQIINKQLKVK